MCCGAYRAGAFAEDAGGGGAVEADDHAEQDRLGLVARECGDESEGVLGGEGLQCLVGGAVRTGQFEYVLFERRALGPYPPPTQQVEGAVAGDGRRPAAEAGPSPLNRPRSREISSQASDATSSASSPTSPLR